VTATGPSIGPPDFIGVGAQRSGTTWWFELLLEHPSIRAPHQGRKELHFFDRFGAEPLRDEDVAAYHELFPRTSGETIGEWTPRYMTDAWTPRLLRRAAPDARLLVLLRDPIERYRSGVVHRATRTPDELLERIASDAIERGRYASQLRHLRAAFDPERILVLQYERCRLDPIGQYRRTLRHLGVSDHVPDDVHALRGTTTEAGKDRLWPELLSALHATLDREVAELDELVDDLDLSLWPNFADLEAGRAA
jgi:hypothetical protein